MTLLRQTNAAKFTQRIAQIVVGGITLLATSTAVHGAFVSFNNATGNGSWSSAANWSNNNLPTMADYATIDSGQVVDSSSIGNMASYIDVLGGAQLNITGGTLNFGGGNNRYFWVGFNSPGVVNQSGGIVTGTGNNTDLVIDSLGEYNMTGGELNLSDDLWLLDKATISLSGAAVLIINDDLGVPANSTATININLTGTVAPLIVVGDALRLQDGVTLNIDSTNWSGAEQVPLFEVNGNVFQDFRAVVVNGKIVDPADYSFAGTSFMVLVPEPASMLVPGLGMLFVFGRRRRRSAT